MWKRHDLLVVGGKRQIIWYIGKLAKRNYVLTQICENCFIGTEDTAARAAHNC